jgi:hypothetical protein
MRGWQLLAITVAGCAKPQTPAALTELVGVSDSASDLIVHAVPHPDIQPDPGYIVKFDGRTLPSSLAFAEREMLVTTPGCARESRVGFGLFPIFIADSGRLDGELTTQLSGPAVAQVTLTFEHPYACASNTLRGTSTFTFFPLGRIVRSDTIDFNQNALPPNHPVPDCNCAGGNQYFLTTFWNFASTPDVDGADNQPLQFQTLPITGGCARYPEGRVGVVFDGDSLERRLLRDTDGSDARTAFVYDVARGMISAGLPPVIGHQVQSGIHLDQASEDCSATLAPLVDHGLSSGTEVASFGDGMYVFSEMTGDEIVVSATEPVPGGFVVSLPHIGSYLEVRPSSGATDGAYYVPQVVPDPDGLGRDRTLVWLRDGLGTGETVTFLFRD